MGDTVSADHSTTIHELLVRNAEAALDIQRGDGSFPPPQYGESDESPTPVRTTAHWLLTLLEACEITGADRFYDAATDAASYLSGNEARPNGYTFHVRDASSKDQCDGVVGQAAPIRALVRASAVLDNPYLATVAQEVVQLHPFDERLGLWERVEIDGTTHSFDRTLNHQLIFAASSTVLVDGHPDISRTVSRFLDTLPSVMRLHEDGLIKHYVRPDPTAALQTVIRNPTHWQLLLNEVVFHYRSRSASHRRTEIGYHPVNLGSLAILYRAFPDHDVWDCAVVQRAIAFARSNRDLYLSGTESYGGSAMPGTNLALAFSTIGGDDAEDVVEFVEADVRRKYDSESALLTQNTSDATFQAAAVHLLGYLPNLTLRL